MFITNISLSYSTASSEYEAYNPADRTTNIHRLKCVHYAVACSITSQLRSTPLEALTREATLPTMATRYGMLTTIQADQWYNLEDEDARKKLHLMNVQLRLKRQDVILASTLCTGPVAAYRVKPSLVYSNAAIVHQFPQQQQHRPHNRRPQHSPLPHTKASTASVQNATANLPTLDSTLCARSATDVTI